MQIMINDVLAKTLRQQAKLLKVDPSYLVQYALENQVAINSIRSIDLVMDQVVKENMGIKSAADLRKEFGLED